MYKLLNVGGNNKAIPLPPAYARHEHLLLDIDPTGQPDIVCDARLLPTLAAEQFDVIYCSHNLEHYYAHDVNKVLAGFHHVLKPDGFIHLRVPDLPAIFKKMVDDSLDLEDVLYESPAGPITFKDIIYGFGTQIEKSGVEFYAHKTGFSQASLARAVQKHGFAFSYSSLHDWEIEMLAFKQVPTDVQTTLLGLPPYPGAGS